MRIRIGIRNKLLGLGMIMLCSTISVTFCSCQKNGGNKSASQASSEVLDEQSDKPTPTQEAAQPEQITDPQFTARQICMFQVNRAGTTRYSLTYSPRTDRQSFLYWDMTVPYDSVAIVDTEKMSKLYQTLSSIKWGKLKTVKADEDTGGTGIESSDTFISISYVNEEQVSEENAQPDKEATLIVGKDNGKGQYFCAWEGAEDTVFLVDTYLIDAALNQEPYDMILKMPYVIDIKTVKEVKIGAGDKSVHMTQKENTYEINGKKVEEEEYKSLYSELLQLEITGECNLDSLDGEKVMTIHYIRTSSEYEEYEATIYKVNDAKYAVQVNGKTFFFVSQESVDKIVETVQKIIL